MTTTRPAGSPPRPPTTEDVDLADREEGAQILLRQALDGATRASLRQILKADRQVEAVQHLLTGLWAATSYDDTGHAGQPEHLGDLWALLMYLNDLGRHRPQLCVIVRDGRAQVVHRSLIAGSPIATHSSTRPTTGGGPR